MAKDTTKEKVIHKAFSYTAENAKNQKVSGEIYAPNLQAAKIMLKRQALKNIVIKKKGKAKKSNKKITGADIAIFFRQLSTMGSAGLSLVDSFQVIIEGTEKEKMKIVLKAIKKDVESGSSFSVALTKHPEYFDELTCSLVGSGEESGTLDKMLDRISMYKEKTEALKRKVKKALIYPATVIFVAGIVTVVLLIKVVPTFKELFESFGADLPAFTQKVLDISDFLRESWILLTVIIGGGAFAFIQSYKKSKSFHDRIDRLTLKLPVIGNILSTSIIARFARTLSTTFAAGVPLTDSLASIARGSGNVVFHDAILKIRDEVSTGGSLKGAIQNSNIFPNMAVQMIGIGEEAGELEEMLTKVANIYEIEVDSAVDNLTTLMEPLIMVILGVIIGSLVIAMYLPIFKLGSAI